MSIEFRGVTKAFANVVLEDFSHCFSEPGFHVILGESGCGKSTLLKLAAGIWKPDKGEVIISKEEKISFLFQEDRLLPWLSARDNVLAVNKDEKFCDKIFSALGLEDAKPLFPDNMSGGMKRRTAIARAVAYDGKIFLMDEPFSGIHVELKQAIMYWLKQQLKGKLCILITHDEQEAKLLGDKLYYFTKNGLKSHFIL